MPERAPAQGAASIGAAALWWLSRREMVRLARQPSRIVATIATPLLMLVLLGSGFARSFAAPGEPATRYAAHLLPAMATAAVVFSAVFGAISLIEDRHAGFLQSVLVSPAPRWSVVGAKLAGGALPAAAQGAVLLLAAPLLDSRATIAGILLAAVLLLLIAIGIGGLSLAAAWRVDSTAGFHGVMNLVLLPMWLLSGSIFPLKGAAAWLGAAMLANPLTWATSALHWALGAGEETPGGPAPALAVTLGFSVAGAALAWGTLARQGGGIRGD